MSLPSGPNSTPQWVFNSEELGGSECAGQGEYSPVADLINILLTRAEQVSKYPPVGYQGDSDGEHSVY